MNMVTVATFNEPSKAEPVKQKLDKAGIHAEICDESKYEWFWFVTRPIAGIRLKVHKKDFETARRLLREWDAGEGILREAVRCPRSEEHTSELQSHLNLVCRLLLEKKKKKKNTPNSLKKKKKRKNT